MRLSVLMPAQNCLVWGIKMMVAGWVYWQPCFEQSQQNRTMPRHRPLSCDIIMKDGLTMKCCQIQFFLHDVMLTLDGRRYASWKACLMLVSTPRRKASAAHLSVIRGIPAARSPGGPPSPSIAAPPCIVMPSPLLQSSTIRIPPFLPNWAVAGTGGKGWVGNLWMPGKLPSATRL